MVRLINVVWSRDLVLAPAFIVRASDLHPAKNINKTFGKVYNDTYLIVSGSQRHTLAVEIERVFSWAVDNTQRLNHQKSRKMLNVRHGSKF